MTRIYYSPCNYLLPSDLTVLYTADKTPPLYFNHRVFKRGGAPLYLIGRARVG